MITDKKFFFKLQKYRSIKKNIDFDLMSVNYILKD